MNTIIVGNIGQVYHGNDDNKAKETYNEYVEQSKTDYGRAAGEGVLWMQDGEIHKEFAGHLTNA